MKDKSKLPLPAKKTVKKTGKAKNTLQNQPSPMTHTLNITECYAKVIDSITIDDSPTVVICTIPEKVPAGRYFIKNINDVMIIQKLRIETNMIEYDGKGRIELIVMNLMPLQVFHLEQDFTIAKLIAI